MPGITSSFHSRVSFKVFLFSLRTNRAQALDTGYYTCTVTNGRGKRLERYFNLRVEGKE